MKQGVNNSFIMGAANTSFQKMEWNMSPGLRYFLYLAVHVLLIVLLSAFAVPSAASADTGRGYLDLGGGYKTGDFGTPTTSSLYYLSSTIGYVAPRYDVSVTVPYLSLTNKASGQSLSESGIGDVILRGGAVFIPEGSIGFSLNGTMALKLPTADDTKGLGTGETDYGAFLGMHQRIENFKLSLTGGYIKIGDPAAINYNDIYLYGVGISRIFGRTNIAASFEGRRAMVPGAENPQEVSVGFFHVLSVDYAIRGSAFKGLNNGGPDFGMDFGIVRWF
ncbi:MAG: transporter [Nitrospirae bacterium]|nr:transporter [Nitrospirota bacterium]